MNIDGSVKIGPMNIDRDLALVLAVIAVLASVVLGGVVGGSFADSQKPDPDLAAIEVGNVALCNDGGYSTNTDFSATCSAGDGVKRWLARFGECMDGTIIEMSRRSSCSQRGFKGLLLPTTTTTNTED